MTYDTYRLLFYIMRAAFLIMLALTMVLFFVLHISSVIGDLTGRTARRGIENIRNQNSASGDKRHMPSAVNRRRGKVTDRISASGKLMNAPKTNGFAPSVTEQILNKQAETSETTVLDQGSTTVLEQEVTTVLDDTAASEPSSYPVPYSEESVQTETPPEAAAFSVDYEITYLHTDEVIP